jgi:hypothetical protein
VLLAIRFPIAPLGGAESLKASHSSGYLFIFKITGSNNCNSFRIAFVQQKPQIAATFRNDVIFYFF